MSVAEVLADKRPVLERQAKIVAHSSFTGSETGRTFPQEGYALEARLLRALDETMVEASFGRLR